MKNHGYINLSIKICQKKLKKQYILAKNVNPEYINKLFNNPEGDRQNNTFQWHPETLTISLNTAKNLSAYAWLIIRHGALQCRSINIVWSPTK